MTDHDAFLAAIMARPDDDLPRLVYADYLDEQGVADRAEFIRVQCELARLPGDDPERPALEGRESALREEHKRRWEIPGLKGGQEFRRGFVEAVQTAAEWLLAVPADVLAAAPLRHLRIGGGADRFVEPLSRLPLLGRLESLDLGGNSFGSGNRLEQFLSGADLNRLTHLDLSDNRLWPDNLHVLARSAVLKRLDCLDVSGNPLSDAGAEVLAGEAEFGRLSELLFRSDGLQFYDSVHAAGAQALARSGTLTRLRVLNLRGHHIGDAGVIDLADSPLSNGLVELDVSNNEIGSLGETAFEAIATSRHLKNLRVLNLDRSQVSRLAAEALVGWPRLRDGVWVSLRQCEFGPGAMKVIAQSPVVGQFDLDQPAELVPVGPGRENKQ